MFTLGDFDTLDLLASHEAGFLITKVNNDYIRTNQIISQFIEIVKDWKVIFGGSLPNYNLSV